MSELAWFLVGLMSGGCVGVTILCCLQLKRTTECEMIVSAAQTEVERLKQELNNVRVG